jgi:transmembrane sensor
MRRWAWIGGIAAALILGVVTWRQWQHPPPPAQYFTTDETVQRSIALEDGSVMDVNVGSDVAVQFSANERRVTLQRGEAHFQVAHNVARPFIVTAGNVSVRAVGTAFEVRMTSDAVDVVVVEGKVQLGRKVETPASVAASSPPLLIAGERAQLTRADSEAPPKIEKIDAESIRSLLTWQNPMASFTDVPLGDVVTRFNRRNITQLTVADSELAKRKIGGKMPLDRVDAFVRLLEQDGDIVADRTVPGRITLHRAR